VHPNSAVEAALPLLSPPARHYAAQWEKMMVEDLDLDAVIVSVDASEVPDGIAPAENGPELYQIALAYVTGYGRELLEYTGRVLRTDFELSPSNTDEFSHEIEVFDRGIVLWNPADQ
jgi:hypothetical protein